MVNKIKRGEIYLADLNPVIGSEQSGVRPVLIIQNDIGNTCSSTVIVAAITKLKNCKGCLPTHLCVDNSCGLDKNSVILFEQIRTIDKVRLKKYIGILNIENMKGIDKALSISLGINNEEK